MKTCDVLRALRDPENVLADHGICYTVFRYVYDRKIMDLKEAERLQVGVEDAMLLWPERWRNTDGNTHPYPVGGPIEYQREADEGTMWQNPRRLELLEWLIEYFESKGN